jgi:hypothetical protein
MDATYSDSARYGILPRWIPESRSVFADLLTHDARMAPTSQRAQRVLPSTVLSREVLLRRESQGCGIKVVPCRGTVSARPYGARKTGWDGVPGLRYAPPWASFPPSLRDGCHVGNITSKFPSVPCASLCSLRFTLFPALHSVPSASPWALRFTLGYFSLLPYRGRPRVKLYGFEEL